MRRCRRTSTPVLGPDRRRVPASQDAGSAGTPLPTNATKPVPDRKSGSQSQNRTPRLTVALGGSDDEAGLTGEVRGSVSSLSTSSIGVRRVSLPGRGDRGGGAVVLALSEP